jgi:hypothetical protein
MDLISKEDNVGQSTYKWTVIYESGEIVELNCKPEQLGDLVDLKGDLVAIIRRGFVD